MKTPVYLSWSGGKDSALALFELQQSEKYEVVGLLTTITQEYRRISIHGVRESLLEMQAASLNLPLKKFFISSKANNAEYETAMAEVCEEIKNTGIHTIAFGDIFLADVREYRERNLARLGMKAIFPLWNIPSKDLIDEYLRNGFQAIVVACDSEKLTKSYVGKILDGNFFALLPSNVDWCGENGEFHSFVFESPNFQQKLPIKIGEKVFRNKVWYCDILPLK